MYHRGVSLANPFFIYCKDRYHYSLFLFYKNNILKAYINWVNQAPVHLFLDVSVGTPIYKKEVHVSLFANVLIFFLIYEDFYFVSNHWLVLAASFYIF